MRKKIKETLATCDYKGHVIRKVEDEFGCEYTFIDNFNDDFEDAPAYMQEEDFWYASIADAKRFINGKDMKWLPGFLDCDCVADRFWNRFK